MIELRNCLRSDLKFYDFQWYTLNIWEKNDWFFKFHTSVLFKMYWRIRKMLAYVLFKWYFEYR